MPGKISNGAAGPTRKKKVSNKQQRPKKGLSSYARAVVKYLVSDTYMYAPLVEEAAVDDGGSSCCRPVAANGTPISHFSTEAFSKIGAKLSAKRSLYEEFVERSYR